MWETWLYTILCEGCVYESLHIYEFASQLIFTKTNGNRHTNISSVFLLFAVCTKTVSEQRDCKAVRATNINNKLETIQRWMNRRLQSETHETGQWTGQHLFWCFQSDIYSPAGFIWCICGHFHREQLRFHRFTPKFTDSLSSALWTDPTLFTAPKSQSQYNNTRKRAKTESSEDATRVHWVVKIKTAHRLGNRNVISEIWRKLHYKFRYLLYTRGRFGLMVAQEERSESHQYHQKSSSRYVMAAAEISGCRLKCRRY